MAEALEHRDRGRPRSDFGRGLRHLNAIERHGALVVFFFAVAVFLLSTISPPGLMDDVDSVQAQIARNMLQSGDWVTARLDGVPYLEKAPLPYWLMAASFRVFGVHDWVARLPGALAAILLCMITFHGARWAIGSRAGPYAGLVLSTCVGLFLFTRILIPDCALTLTITAMLYAVVRLLDGEEKRATQWAMVFWVSMAAGVLLKGLIAIVFPALTVAVFVLFTGDLRTRESWKRFRIVPGLFVLLLFSAPWHVMAALANPPYFDFTMHSEAGAYHGFLWFYFLNEHLFRFLNIRYPRDYNTVPRALFWTLHLLWLFPWSVYLPSVFQLRFGSADRASRTRTLALCWIGVILIFFTFSTTQEYYSLPCYPAFAILLGSAIASETRLVRFGTRLAATIAAVLCCLLSFLFLATRGLPTPGDISVALTQHQDMYTLSMGHMLDLTFNSFAYLRTPLALAALATLIGAAGGWMLRSTAATLSLAVMMVLFFQAARLALIVFDPYLGSRHLAEILLRSPEGRLILDDQYYSFSSIVFYTNRQVLLLNGRKTNLEYGSYAPGVPNPFIDDANFAFRWASLNRYYIAADQQSLPRLRQLAAGDHWFVVDESGGKALVTNRELSER